MTVQEAPEPTGNKLTWLRALGVAALLLVILAAGAALRLTGIDWDEGYLPHPDERFMAWVAADMRPVDSVAAYFDTPNSTLNPNNVGHEFYVYGDLPVLLLRAVGEAVGRTSLYTIYLPGRVLSVCADLLTVLLVWLVTRRLFGWRAGLIASALYAGSALAVQQSHFFTVDTFTNLFVVASFLFAARALEAHRWPDYVLFGLFLGLGMSSKVSIAPLALILVVAVGLRTAREIARQRREGVRIARPIRQAVIGLAVAGLVTVFVFRVAQPYAFLPFASEEPIDAAQVGPVLALVSRLGNPIGFRPNPAWIAQMQEIRRWVTGHVDAPPNHQWARRLPLVFPWLNMVRVGMGWPAGLFVWLAFLWALWEIGRGQRGALRLVLPVTWIAFLFTWQGIGWVTTMRYFLPIYPFLYMLGGWALVTMGDRVRALIAARGAPRWHWSRLGVVGLGVLVVLAGCAWGLAVSRIYTRPVTRIAATRWVLENVPGDVTLLVDTADGPRQVQLELANDWPPADDLPDDPTQPDLQYSYLVPEAKRALSFEMPFDGSLTGIRLNHVVDPLKLGAEHTLDVLLLAEGVDTPAVFAGSIYSQFAATADPRGQSYRLDVPNLPLPEGERYTLWLQPDATGPLVVAGATIATEGEWDDPVPLSMPPYNVWGALYQPLELNLVWEDTPEKLARLQYVLDHTDYLTISSNRFYASLTRNPQRWPLTIAYYQALFSGELGFELVADFASRPALGPVEFVDDNAEEAWTVYDHPRVFVFRKTANYSPQRTAAILGSVDLGKVVRRIAGEAQGRVVRLRLPPPRSHAQAAAGVIDLGASADWTHYDPRRTDFWSRAQPATVVAWWVVVGLVGWAAFPLLWGVLPGLPDRGYPLARIFGLLFTAWLAWLLASLKALPWTGWTVLLAAVVLAALSAAVVWPRRVAFAAWLRTNRYHVLIVEAGLAALFVAFVLVRLGNPDLWHPVFGGEKPMDLAYFNAVLRSTTFPPYDPWYAGGTINYYYFGFVIVGVPVKLLGIPVTLAYNLIIPTLFAVTGGAAFSAAFNLTAPAEPAPGRPGQSRSLWDHLERPGVSRAYLAGIVALLLAVVLGNLDQVRTALWGLAELGHGSPEWAMTLFPDWVDTLRGLRITLQDGVPLPVGLGEWYWNATRLIPVPLGADGNPTEVGPITEFPFFTFLYADLHAHMIAMPLTLFVINWGIAQVRGVRLASETDGRLARPGLEVLGGFVGALAIGALRPTNTWDYPTYLVLGVAALTIAHVARRAGEAALPALGMGGIGALAVGGLLFGFSLTTSGSASSGSGLVLALLGAAIGLPVGFALGRAITRPDGWSGEAPDGLSYWLVLLGAGWRALVLAGATAFLFLPFIRHYRLGYDRVIAWTGSRTTVWAFLDILGLFLFVIATWLAFELWRWLRHLKRQHVMPLLLALAAVGGATALVGASLSPAAVVAVPMLAAAVALFFRPGQTPEKRLALLMLLGALALTMVVEGLVLAGDLSRMNTVFKFYLQVWLLLAVVAGAAFAWLWPALLDAPDALRLPWSLALAGLVFLSALYPLMASRVKVEDRWNPDAPHTLDGMAYLPTVTYGDNGVYFSLLGDYEALRWLQDNIQGNPVVLEALSWREYLWGNRVSVYTGLPAVVGWSWHQRQQRPPEAGDVLVRHIEVREMYETSNLGRTLELFDHYGVDLIIVGDLERAYYSPAGLEKFPWLAEKGLLEVIYDRNGTAIYRVVRERASNP